MLLLQSSIVVATYALALLSISHGIDGKKCPPKSPGATPDPGAGAGAGAAGGAKGSNSGTGKCSRYSEYLRVYQ